MTQILGFLAGPLSVVMQLIYNLVGSYGWTIVIITILVRLIMFPLSLKQEKSRAKTAAYQPMIREIQNKYKNDKTKQQQEVMKFQEENGIKMTAGCLPMLINMIVLFAIIAVIQSPLKYMLNVPAEQIDAGVAIVQQVNPESEINKNLYTRESILIGEIIKGDISKETLVQGTEITNAEGVTTTVKMDAEWVDKIADYKFDFLGLNLAQTPDNGQFQYILLPILSVLTQLISQFVIMRMSKKETEGQPGGQATMWVMTLVMSVFFGFYAFTVPVGFSLYYTISNLAMMVQQILVRKIHDPEKIKQEVLDEIEARKKAKKAKKKIIVKTEDGKNQIKELTQEELDRIRLQKARERNEEKYKDDEDENSQVIYKRKTMNKFDETEQIKEEIILEKQEKSTDEKQQEIKIEQEEVKDDSEKEINNNEEQNQNKEYKPGRRKKAKEKKKSGYNTNINESDYDTKEQA